DDLDIGGHHEAAALDKVVPLQVVVEAVDDAGRVERGALQAPRILGQDAGALHLQHDFLGHVADGQVAHEFRGAVLVVDLAHGRGREPDLGKLFRVEEVVALQVVVAALVVGADAGDLDDGVAGGGLHLFRVEREAAADVGERAGHGGNAHVADAELDVAVRGVDVVVGGEDGTGGTDREQQGERGLRAASGESGNDHGKLLEGVSRVLAAGPSGDLVVKVQISR